MTRSVAVATVLLAASLHAGAAGTPVPDAQPEPASTALSISFSTPAGRVGTLYYAEPVAWNATYPLTLELAAGTLPPGTELRDGALYGTPTTTGEYTFTLNIRDQSGTLRTLSRAVAIGEALPSSEHLVDFDQSEGTTFQLAGNVGVKRPLELEGFAGSSRTFCGGIAGWWGAWDDLAEIEGVVAPTFGDSAGVAILEQGQKASITLEFPVPIHELELTAGTGQGSMMISMGGSGLTLAGPQAFARAEGCKWWVHRRREQVGWGDGTQKVVVELEGFSGPAITFIDDIVGRRIDCQSPLPPRSFGRVSEITAGERVDMSWNQGEALRTTVSAWADELSLGTYVRDGRAAITTVPSAKGYNLQVRATNWSTCTSPSGLSFDTASARTVRNYQVAPGGAASDEPLSLQIAPRIRIPHGTVLSIYGTGIVPSLEQAKELGLTRASPTVSSRYDFECLPEGNRLTHKGTRFSDLEVVSARPDLVEIRIPDLATEFVESTQCSEPDPFVTTVTVTNAKKETATFELEIVKPRPRSRSTRK
jgi:hypothetical protein